MIALNKASEGWQNLYKNTVLGVSVFEHYTADDANTEMSLVVKAVRHFKD